MCIYYHLVSYMFGAYCAIFRENLFLCPQNYCYICDYTG